jgi:alkylated DNA nucleotide flippase Atl1
MVKKRISGEEREKLVLDLYYNQNKTYRDVTKLAGAYPREIKAILKKADPSQSRSPHSQAYQLFDEGKTVTQVAITLDLRQPQATELFTEYWLLKQQDQLYKIFQEIKNNIQYFLELYKHAIAAGMSIQDVVRALNIAKNDKIH